MRYVLTCYKPHTTKGGQAYGLKQSRNMGTTATHPLSRMGRAVATTVAFAHRHHIDRCPHGHGLTASQ